MVYRTNLTPLFSLRREMDRLVDESFGRPTQPASAWSPAADLREDAQAWHFALDLPGVDPSRVEVTTDQGVLTIRGETSTARGDADAGRWHLMERPTGAFRRSFRLPQQVQEERIEASFAHGLLTVRVPKAELPKPKRVEIRT